MAPLTTAQLRSLLTPPATPCISLYLPTHRSQPERREDPIRYRNLVGQAEDQLRARYPGAQVQAALEKFRALQDDVAFWSGSQDGLGVLAAGDFFRTFWLPRAVKELAVVADSFHVKPLLRLCQSADRFHVLGITRTEATIWEGDRYGLRPIPDPQLTFTEAVGEELEVLPGAQRSKNDRGGREFAPHYSGHGGRKDELDADLDKFMRAINRTVLDKYSQPTGWPLVLAGLPQNVAEFRKHSQNPFIVPGEVSGDPGAFTPDQLRANAWKVLEPQYLSRLARLKEDYGTAASRGLGSKEPAAVAAAALDGRVGLLLVDADKVVPGKVDVEGRTVRSGQLGSPDVDDVLDDLAELVLKTGGEVIVVPADRMPTDTGLAAIYRF